ncbi:hypothetical protein KUV51_19555 [Tateyamaria omphalii]|uniref:hypothetical protein n=1 Tax=Tateyamaria omphalii TaxID=299262 RepID=UPI001C9A0CEA|nr:hypothetical protein [Tateyamaria omphalii]MBY5935212.1 hypothetical protein [Tateyamaria omphalii]
MMRTLSACALLALLGACGDPLSGIERVSEGAVLPPEPGANVLPTEEELARQESVLSGLFRDPAAGAEENAQTPVANPDQIDADTATVSDADNALPVEPAPSDAIAGAGAAAAAPQAEPASGGLFGWLRRASQSDTDPQTLTGQDPVEAGLDAPTETQTDAEPVVTAAVSPEALVEPEKRRRLFGGTRNTPRTGPDGTDVAPGMIVPFGQIARNCDAQPARLGKVVDKAAGKGRGYVLYDTAPDSTAPRTFYVTGFADNCPRQFTAALALFGEPAFHEQLRYGLPADEYPYSTTDEAYEKLKRRVCNVGRNKPCGGRIDRLARNTTFISAYENFTDNGRWADMLLHDGAVLAAALKTP